MITWRSINSSHLNEFFSLLVGDEKAKNPDRKNSSKALKGKTR